MDRYVNDLLYHKEYCFVMFGNDLSLVCISNTKKNYPIIAKSSEHSSSKKYWVFLDIHMAGQHGRYFD